MNLQYSQGSETDLNLRIIKMDNEALWWMQTNIKENCKVVH